MNKLTVDIFISSLEDIEMAKYQILSVLKQYSKLFHQNKIYPYLAELIETGYILAKMVEQKPDLGNTSWDDLIQINLENTSEKYDSIFLTADELNEFFNLVNWALPLIEEIVDEGKIIYDFVEENIDILQENSAGGLKETGYFLIPDNKYDILNVYYFELRDQITGQRQYHQLNTTHIDTLSKVEASKQSFSELIKNYVFEPEKPAFYFRTELDFPFAETLLPIVKRKLTEKIAVF